MQSADGGTMNRRIPRGGRRTHALVNSVEVCKHLFLGKRFESIEAEATSFEGWTSVRGNHLGVEIRGNRKF